MVLSCPYVYFGVTFYSILRKALLRDDGRIPNSFNIWNQIYSLETFKQEITEGRFEVADILDDVCGKPYTGQEVCICGVYKRI